MTTLTRSLFAALRPLSTAGAALFCAGLLLSISGAQTFAAGDEEQITRMVELLNPAQTGEDITRHGPFVGEPASDIAAAVKAGTWFSFFVFLPFLVLPQILLVVIIFKFRAKANPNPPATFTHNMRLEFAWTAIPVVALLVVAVPITRLLSYQETPPLELARGNAFTMEVVGRQYSWIYNYPEEDLRVANFSVRDLPQVRQHILDRVESPERMNVVQESAVFPKGRTATLFLTSQDVNHAWWVPAFGVKKDTFADRHTHTWFTPTKVGFFEGTCAELCGADHGIMKITATVLEPEDYRAWVRFKRHERPAQRVVDAIREGEDEGAEAFTAYVEEDSSPLRLQALRFWMAYDTAIHTTLWREAATRPFAGGIDGFDEYIALSEARVARLQELLENFLQQQQLDTPEGTDA